MAIASTFPTVSRSGPQNPEAERALLGGMLLDNRKIPEVLEEIPQAARRAFYYEGGSPMRRHGKVLEEPLLSVPANQEIFEVIGILYDRDQGADLTTLNDELERLDRLDAGHARAAGMQSGPAGGVVNRGLCGGDSHQR